MKKTRVIFLFLVFIFLFSGIHGFSKVNFTKIGALPALHEEFTNLCMEDLDNNGRNELIYTLHNPYTVRAYEWMYSEIADHSNPFSLVFDANEGYLLWDAGDSDGDHLKELVGNHWENVFVDESLHPKGFPVNRIWEDMKNTVIVTRMTIDDLDQDGSKELLFCGDTLASDPMPHGDFGIYEQTAELGYTLVLNSGHYPGYNHIWVGDNPTGDFDGDGWNEIVLSSVYGELAVLENTGNDSYQFTWSSTFAAPNVYYGGQFDDIDNNGRKEFILGGMQYPYPPIGQPGFRYFALFESTGNNSYAVVRNWVFEEGLGFVHDGELAVGDTDGDGYEELALSTGENVYLYAYTEPDHPSEGWRLIYTFPVFGYKGQVFMHDIDNDGRAEIMINNFGNQQLEIFKRSDTTAALSE